MFHSTSSSSQYNVHLSFPYLTDLQEAGHAPHISPHGVCYVMVSSKTETSLGKGISLNKKVNHSKKLQKVPPETDETH